MYFHVVGIKEKNGKKYDLDIILGGGDEDFIRKFLANRGIVIVSITEFKENPESFGNIVIEVIYDNTQIKIFTKGEDLEERVYFIMYSGITPSRVNFVSNPIPEDQMKSMIDSNIAKIKEEDEKIKKEKELEELEEQKKYEETGIKDGLKIINRTIDHIEQLIKVGEGIIVGNELRDLDNYLNEMKKIRLGTNFNKMVNLISDSQSLVKNVEREIIEANSSHKFLIDKNSIVSNIDVLEEYFSLNKLSDKGKLQPGSLRPSESAKNLLGSNSIFLSLLRRDISNTVGSSELGEVFDITINMIEYIILTTIEVVSIMWMLTLCFGIGNFSNYLLPALGWLGLLVYLFNNLKLKGLIIKSVGFVILVLIYWRGLLLLLSTFAL